MTEDRECSVFDPCHIFSAIKYKALDYVCESSTFLRVTRNWLTLPMPYHLGDSDQYPHTGKPPDATYRKPWIRGNKISSCKLFDTGSVLEGLKGNGQSTDFLESLRLSVTQVNSVIPSSNPNSQMELDRDEACWLLQESTGNTLYNEDFGRSTTEKMYHRSENEDLLLPEEVMLVDHLPQFRRHLPTLKAKVSRLRTLAVSDPLLSHSGACLSEQSILRHCAGVEVPHATKAESLKANSDVYEEFSKELMLNAEHLLLPVELGIFTLERELLTHFPNIQMTFSVAPEIMKDQTSCLDLLSTAMPSGLLASVYISQFQLTYSSSGMNEGLHSHPAGRLRLPTDMELDLALSPSSKPSLTQLCVSPSQLLAEPVAPVYRHYLVSEREQEEMEQALWKAEKHHTFVLGFLLTEPQVFEPAIQFQSLAAALTLMKINQEGSVSLVDKGDLPSIISAVFEGRSTDSSVFSESLNAGESPSEKAVGEMAEHFHTLPPYLIDYLLRDKEDDNTPPSYPSAPPGLPSELKVKSILKRHATPSSQEQETPQNDSSPPRAATSDVRKERTANGVFSRHTTPTATDTVRTGVLQEHANAPSSKETCSHTVEPVGKPQQNVCVPKPTTHLRPGGRDSPKALQGSRALPQRDLDPLSTFMMLRSQQRASVSVAPLKPASTSIPKVMPYTPQPDNPPTTELGPDEDGCPLGVSTPVPGNTQEAASRFVSQQATVDRLDSKVIQVQATESQWRAYCELEAFAQPCICKATELGLSPTACGSFCNLAPDHTRFLLKQQERELSMTQGHEQEVLFNQVALIHVLVTVKDLLLTCDLTTAAEYLSRAAETCSGQRLEQLSRRLWVVLYLGQRSQEPCPKLLELQEQVAAWLCHTTGLHSAARVLVILSVNSDSVRETLIQGLQHATGQPVAAVCPEEGRSKLSGTRVLDSLRGSVCVVVVCSQHMGADFPWHSFSLVVEYHSADHSPWPRVCRDRDLPHLTFHTCLPSNVSDPSWSLEQNVPYVLIVTEGLVNCPPLLQILESSYNVTVLERSHCQALQMLGGTHHYAVVTVDESTAVIIQDQEELCQDGACESLVMRLTALSLQYSCCWLLLHCPDSQCGGLTSESFSNLVLVYSSLVLFGMKAEDLDVKVLIVSDVVNIAKWLSRICCHCLMASNRDPVSYLERAWLSVLPSEEEKCLLAFPCVNPLVCQLMLSRAPSLQWLLGALLDQLVDLLPEVPHKVLKLFSDTTSLYALTTEPSDPDPPTGFSQPDPGVPQSPWSSSRGHKRPLSSNPEPFLGQQARSPLSSSRTESQAVEFDLHGPAMVSQECGEFQVDLGPSVRSPSTSQECREFQVDLGPSVRSPSTSQNSWSHNNPWEEEKIDEVEESTRWMRGGEGDRRADEWMERAPPCQQQESYGGYPTEPSNHPTTENPFKLEALFSYKPNPQRPAYDNDRETLSHTPGYRDYQHHGSEPYQALSSSRGALSWAGTPARHSPYSVSGGLEESPGYGTSYRTGLERKRRAHGTDVVSTVLMPVKRGKLSYEKVPGRSDGQTRLRFF